MKMNKKSHYLKLCKEVDLILIRSGIRQRCINCSKGVKDYRTKELKVMYPEHKGCCNGCLYLKEDGCKTISLVCKLWLCDGNLVKLMSEADRKRFNEIIKEASYQGWLEYRKSVEDYFDNKRI